MTDLFQEPDDATPLDPALRGDLLQTWITSRADLNEAEEENIVKGATWGRGRRRGKTADLLTEDFVKTLHKQMFGEVWKWAGTYRQGELNIGIAPHLVAAEMPVMLDNARYWVEHETYSLDEIAARLHHRLTQIHGFPNGNGRHARMMADLVIERLGGKAFSWGGGGIGDVGTLRNSYVASLQAADNHDIAPLLAFMRS
ncbi:Fic-DOC domain mobile mystery protein B [Tardiphaga robiniae]|uniref:mobile mystery protein B n=1 Tax=Tardiphaga robiniae TaxID=943830 RepID=UPI00285A06CB|nr:mobile mystery protein B [Tardiphaga robiniae]MDR6661284.1 Fic-DOC domain mobile mystery protein B [Tardiphaga robiniae]